MGTISKRHQGELDAMAIKAKKTWDWTIGSDVNPSLLDPEDLAEVYNEIFAGIRWDLDGFAKRVGSVGHSESYLRGSFFPKIWVTLSSIGTFYDFDFDINTGEFVGDIRPSTPGDLRRRLLRKTTDAGRMHRQWNDNNRSDRTAKRKAKHHDQVRWNQGVVDAFDEMAMAALESPTGTPKEQMGQTLVALQWFGGRRAWSEMALRADFEVVDGPEWADGWVKFSGHAKRTLAEKQGEIEAKSWPIPLFGIDPSDFVEAFQKFRALESVEPWFDPTDENGHVMVKDALFYSTQKVLKKGFAAQAIAPITEAGYNYELTMHRFRDLYVSRGHWYQSRWSRVNGQAAPNIQSWAAQYLGHFGDGSEQDTGEYLRLEFLGADPIPKIG